MLFEDKEETEKKNRDCGVLNFSKILYFLYEIFYRKCSDHTSIPVMLLFYSFLSLTCSPPPPHLLLPPFHSELCRNKIACDWLGWQGCIPQFWLLAWWFGVFFCLFELFGGLGFFCCCHCLFVYLLFCFGLFLLLVFVYLGFFLLMSLAIVFPSQCSGG